VTASVRSRSSPTQGNFVGSSMPRVLVSLIRRQREFDMNVNYASQERNWPYRGGSLDPVSPGYGTLM